MNTHDNRKPGTSGLVQVCDAERNASHVGAPHQADGHEPTMNGGLTLSPIAQLAAALAKAQATIRPASRTGLNPHYGSRYADLASIWSACRDPLAANGLSVVQMPDFDPATRCASVTTLLLHSSGEYMASTLRAPIAKADPQGVGSAITYLRRYALASFVGVAPDDDDGEAASHPTHGDEIEVTSASAPTRLPVWPVGDKAGTPLRDFSDQQLFDGRKWCAKKNKEKFAELIGQIDDELERRGLEDAESAA